MNRRCLNCMNIFEIPAGYEDDDFCCPHCGFVENTPPKVATHLHPGTVLNNKFIIGTVLGAGGFGITYKAWNRTLETVVAIKEYFPKGLATRVEGSTVSVFSNDDDQSYDHGKERFLKEARNLVKFNAEQGTAFIYEFFEENNTAYIVMEYLDGCSLKDYYKKNGVINDRKLLYRMTNSICDVLAKVHKAGLMHGDISPDNIFMCRNGIFKLIDFGAMKQNVSDNNLSSTIVMKHGYAPTEQYSRNGRTGPWTDVYAFAATLYYLVTGTLPPDSVDRFQSDEMQAPIEINPDIDETLNEVILKGMAVKIEDRYKDIDSFRKALFSDKTIVAYLKGGSFGGRGTNSSFAAYGDEAEENPTELLRYKGEDEVAPETDEGYSQTQMLSEDEEGDNPTEALRNDNNSDAEENGEGSKIETKEETTWEDADSEEDDNSTVGLKKESLREEENLLTEDDIIEKVQLEEEENQSETYRLTEDDTKETVQLEEEENQSETYRLTEDDTNETIQLEEDNETIRLTEDDMNDTIQLEEDSESAAGESEENEESQLGFLDIDEIEEDSETKAKKGTAAKSKNGSESGAKKESDNGLEKKSTKQSVPSTSKKTEKDKKTENYKTENKEVNKSADTTSTNKSERNISEKPGKSSTDNSGRKMLPIIAGVAAAVILVVVGLVMILGSKVIVPDVTGKTESEAVSILEGEGLKANITYNKSLDQPEGTVISQVDIGSKLKKGSSVEVVVCDGKLVKVPDTVGKTEEEAVDILKGANLKAEISKEYSDTVGRGLVISQSETDVAEDGGSVTISVSLGSENISVPNVTGLDEATAVKTLEDLGLVVATEDAYDSSVEEGKVLGQSAEEGSSQKNGDKIKLTVCRGADPNICIVEDVAGKSLDDAKTALAGLSVETSEEYSAEVEKGNVISQDVASGTELEKGSTVKLIISKGPEPAKKQTQKQTQQPAKQSKPKSQDPAWDSSWDF